MPIYEYRCTACGHELEALQKLRDAPLSVCPACQKAALTKLVSAAGFQLKGSGWYVTDFRNSGAKAPAKDKTSGGDAAATGNGSGASAEAGAAAGSADAGKSETKGTEKKTGTSTATESKPSVATTSTTKSDT